MGLHFIEKKHLSIKGLLKKIFGVFKKTPDLPRDPRGLKSTISITDCLMSALAMFGLKYQSLLQFIQSQAEKATRHNLKTLYKIDKVPSDTYMRKRLDEIDPKFLRSAFTHVFSTLQRGKILEDYKFLHDYILVACDGTGIFSSKTVHCDNCCQKNHKDGTITYYHQMLAGVVVHPDQTEVFPFCPEPISKSDGSTKNDCEQNAMRRFLEHFHQEHPRLKVIIIADALSSKGPYIQQIQKIGAHFILGVKPDGNKSLFEWIKGIELEQHEVKTKEGLLQYRFINAIPLNDANPDMEVNYFECCIKDKNGEIKSLFTWITDIHITKKNVHELSKGGRARWRIENETFNTLKNQGYNFEHNYGHGYKHLNHVFGLLMFLAFLIDQVQQHSCALFQAALKKMKSRIRLWEKLRSSFTIFHVDSWEIMYAHIASDPRVKLIWLDSS